MEETEFRALADLVGSTMRALQVFLVDRGIKPGCRIIIPEKKYKDFQEWCGQKGLCLSVSSIKMPTTEGYTDGGICLPRDDPREGNPLVFIAKARMTAIALKAAEDLVDHPQMGSLLGYPACCISFFTSHFPSEAKNGLSFIAPMVAQSEGYSYPRGMNIFARYDDAAVLFHCPCSLDCAESQTLAHRHLQAIDAQLPTIAKALNQRLQKTESWNGRRFIFS